MNNITKTLELLTERYINLFTPEEKEPYVDIVWNLIQNAYSYAGGIKGSGFNSKEDMVNKLPMWKLAKKDGKVVAVRLYKDTQGRKAVASATDTSRKGTTSYREITKEDLKRSWSEISDKALHSLKRTMGDEFEKYIIPISMVKKKFPNEEIRPVGDNFYKRFIGGEWITKLAVGNPNSKKITL